MLNRTKNFNSELEARFIQDRINLVERNVAELCQAFGAYSRKAARLRDKGDDLSRIAMNYSEIEDINKSLSNGLAKFGQNFSTVCNYADKRVQYIDNKVIAELSLYENICKKVKEDVKQIFIVRDKEMLRKKQLDRIRDRNPRSRQQIVQAETELVQATAEVSRTIHSIEEQITTFERQKLHDLKAILSTFILTEIGYHAKALEYLTIAYQDINNIDEETDLQDFQSKIEEMEAEFKKNLQLPEKIPHAARKSLFSTNSSLGSLGNIFVSSNSKMKTPGIVDETRSKSRLTKSDNALDKLDDKENNANENDSDESDESESQSEDTSISDTKKVSPFIAKRYLK